MEENNTQKKSGLATWGLVLGIIGICLSFIIILNNASFFLGILAIIFGIISLSKKSGKGKAIAAIVLGVLSIVFTLATQSMWSESFDKLSKDLDSISSDNTEEVLKSVDIELGNLNIEEQEYGFIDSKMIVKVKNKTKEKKSFSFHIEAVSSDGSRIDEDYVYASNLSPDQSQEFEIFTYISSDKVEAMRNAKFEIVEASMY